MNGRKLARNLVHLIGIGILLAIVVPFVVHALPGLIGADYSFVVLSGSMAPMIQPGDVVMIEEIDTGTLEEGDVIAYVESRDATPTTHRVINVRDTENGVLLQTKGDANEDPDLGEISGQQVLGRLMTVGGYPLVIPEIGHVIRFASTVRGFLILVALPLALFVLTEIGALVWSVRKSSTGVEDDGDSEQETATASDSGGSGGGVTLYRTDLNLALALLFPVVPYTAWIAYRTLDPLHVTAAVGTAVAFLLTVGLYFIGGPAPDVADASGFVLTSKGLQISLGVLVLLAPYFLWLAYGMRTVASIAFAVGAVSLLLLAAAMLLFGEEEPDLEESAENSSQAQATDGGEKLSAWEDDVVYPADEDSNGGEKA